MEGLGLCSALNREESRGRRPRESFHAVAVSVAGAVVVANVRLAFRKGQGNLGSSGSVAFMFDKFGVFRISPEGVEREELELDLIDHGLEAIEDEENEKGEPLLALRCLREEFGTMQAALEERKLEVASSGFVWVPKTPTELSDDQVEDVLKLIMKLEDDDDVQDVFTNLT